MSYKTGKSDFNKDNCDISSNKGNNNFLTQTEPNAKYSSSNLIKIYDIYINA